jgi:hypothetical protein
MITLTKLAETASTITLGWSPVPGCIGYRFSAEKQAKPSHTWDPTKASAKFAKGSAWYKVEALGVEDVGQYPSIAPPPISGLRGVTYMRWADGELPSSHAADYDELFVSWSGAGSAGAQSTRSGVYMSAVSCLEGEGWHYGVKGEDAVANGWVLKQGSRLLRNAGYPGSYIADPASSGYQQRWCDNVIALAQGWKVDGIFIDDFYGSLSLCDGVPDKYPTLAQQRSALFSFAQYVYGRLHAAGLRVSWNSQVYIGGDPQSDTGENTIPWWTMIAPHSDCLVAEYWQWRDNSAQHIRKMGPEWWNHWDTWQMLPAFCETHGKEFIGIAYSDIASEKLYVLCSMLLETTNGSIICGTTTDPWISEFNLLPLGAASGAKVKNGGCWQRQYEHGLVWVDPVAGTAGIT